MSTERTLINAGRLAVARERARREFSSLEASGAKQPLRDARRALSQAEQALDEATDAIITKGE